MRRRPRSAQAGAAIRPAWLNVALFILLLTMVMGAWLATFTQNDVTGISAPVDKQPPRPPKTIVRPPAPHPEPTVLALPAPPVVYESFEETEAVAPVQRESPPAPPAHGIALIVDDMGYSLNAARRVLRLPYPVAVSVLPFSPFAKQTARMAHKAGRVVMVHLPMEPADSVQRRRMDRSFLRADMSEQAVRRLMADALARVPFASGINNHMGSRLTSMRDPMHWVMQVCRERSLFFVDSRTSKDSVAAEEARAAGIRWGERQVFLDHRLDKESIHASWRAAKRLFDRLGSCIVIAHPYGESLRFLEKLPAEDRRHIVPVYRLLHTRNGA